MNNIYNYKLDTLEEYFLSIGEKRFKKKQFCVIITYQYKDKNYETGDCK